MKKAVSIVLILVMCLSLCNCGHEHVFGEWNTVSEPSCNYEGTKERVCECGETQTESIAATGHTFDNSVELSCTEDTTVEAVCTVCGENVTETVLATGHDFKPATVFAPKTCSNCGATEGEALATVIAAGDVVEQDEHSFTVESIAFAGSLSEKRGYVTYYHGSDFALAIKLNFTNLATDAFESWRSARVGDVTLQYKGSYNYEGECWVPVDDIVPLASDTIYIVYEVPKSMSEDASGSIFASFTIDDETYAVVVQEGDGSDAVENSVAENVSGEIVVGDTVSNGTSFSFTMNDISYTNSPSYKDGNITYSYMDGYYLALKFDFTNMDTVAMSDWDSNRITNMVLSFADKYSYDGECWIPTSEIVPLADGVVYILYPVSDTVKNSTDSLVASFTVDGNNFTVDCR